MGSHFIQWPIRSGVALISQKCNTGGVDPCKGLKWLNGKSAMV
jgi:hypothetical protein